jgi:uncharacterized radical SAM superfamily Fe-S cluster-containing enzyme
MFGARRWTASTSIASPRRWVVTLKKGLNDDEIGEIIDFALKQRCVRGVTFQPVQHAGRAIRF